MDMKRRQFNQLVAAGALGAGLSGLSMPALATTGSSLDRVKASGKLRIAGVADGAPYYQMLWHLDTTPDRRGECFPCRPELVEARALTIL